MNRKELAASLAKKRLIPFFLKVDAELFEIVQINLLNLAAESNDPITIYFHSEGGDGWLGHLLGQLIDHLPCNVIGIAEKAHSAACAVLQHCTERLILPAGMVLVHSVQPSPEFPFRIERGQYFHEQIEHCDHLMSWTQRLMRDHLIARTGLPEARIDEIIARGDNVGYLIVAEEAKELNLVDGILPADYKFFRKLKKHAKLAAVDTA